MDKRYVHYEAINNEPDDPEREIEMYYASDVEAALVAEYNRGFAVGSGDEGAYQRRIAELEKALRLIAEHKGKALLGDGRYDEGANAAFNQMADIAASVL